ncbi:MAG TPA: hypothetical protein VE596_02965 [Gaiellaceae bacterium]|nr:hypothetical protein [Gaiellaceae bacterium]
MTLNVHDAATAEAPVTNAMRSKRCRPRPYCVGPSGISNVVDDHGVATKRGEQSDAADDEGVQQRREQGSLGRPRGRRHSAPVGEVVDWHVTRPIPMRTRQAAPDRVAVVQEIPRDRGGAAGVADRVAVVEQVLGDGRAGAAGVMDGVAVVEKVLRDGRACAVVVPDRVAVVEEIPRDG